MLCGSVSILRSITYDKNHTDDDQDMNEPVTSVLGRAATPSDMLLPTAIPKPSRGQANAGYAIPGFPVDFQPGSATRKAKRQSNSTALI